MAGGLQSAGSSHSCRARVFMTYMFLDQACMKSVYKESKGTEGLAGLVIRDSFGRHAGGQLQNK